MKKNSKEKLFTPQEKSILTGLSAALGLRQLGLLLVLPFLSVSSLQDVKSGGYAHRWLKPPAACLHPSGV